MFVEQGSENHNPALVAENAKSAGRQLAQNALGKAGEGKNLQARVSAQLAVCQNLGFDLESGLFRSEEEKRWPFGILGKAPANRLNAAMRLAASSGA